MHQLDIACRGILALLQIFYRYNNILFRYANLIGANLPTITNWIKCKLFWSFCSTFSLFSLSFRQWKSWWWG